MAILHADNFNYYGSSATTFMDDGVYAEIKGPSSIQSDPDGVSTAKCFYMNWQSEYLWRWVLPTAQATVGIAQRVWLTSIPAGSVNTPAIAQWSDGSNVQIARVEVTPTGALTFYNGSTAVQSTTGPVVSANGWYHIECKLTCGLSGAGSVEVRVEGVSVLTASGFSTSSATAAQARGSSGHGASSYTATYIKDLVIWDGSGTANNDFLGSVLVYELTTTADTTFGTGWTSTDANAYSVLDNNPPDDTNHYISADATPPAAAVFALSDLPTDITSVKALVTRVRAAKSDGGDGQFKVSMKSGSSVDDGADRPITTAQTYWSDVSELDPATAAAWTPTSVNAAELELTRTL